MTWMVHAVSRNAGSCPRRLWTIIVPMPRSENMSSPCSKALTKAMIPNVSRNSRRVRMTLLTSRTPMPAPYPKIVQSEARSARRRGEVSRVASSNASPFPRASGTVATPPVAAPAGRPAIDGGHNRRLGLWQIAPPVGDPDAVRQASVSAPIRQFERIDCASAARLDRRVRCPQKPAMAQLRRILYALGPGDAVHAYREWREGRDVSSETSLTFSGQFFAYCRGTGTRAIVLSAHPRRQVV